MTTRTHIIRKTPASDVLVSLRQRRPRAPRENRPSTAAYDEWQDLEWEEHAEARELVEAEGPMSLDDIGTVLGMSRERVRQIIEGALRKLAADAAGVDRGVGHLEVDGHVLPMARCGGCRTWFVRGRGRQRWCYDCSLARLRKQARSKWALPCLDPDAVETRLREYRLAVVDRRWLPRRTP